MKLGLFQNIQWPETTDQTSQFTGCIEQTLRAEQLGFDSSFFVEHHFTRHGILSSTLALLSYLAAQTRTIRLGTAVLVLPFHDPVRLAEEAATVDLLSGGRLDLGVGRGFQWTEFNGFDLSLEDSTARYDEALEVILKAWREPGRFTHEGRFWRYNDISVEPKPAQTPHPPVWAAAGSVESATRVGRLGLHLQLSSGVSFDRIPVLLEAYKAGLAESGHTFSSDHVLLSRITHIEETRAKAWEVATPYYEWFRKMVATVTPAPGRASPFNTDPLTPRLSGPIGYGEGDPGFFFCTPDECCRAIEEIGAMGIGQVIFQGNWGGMPQADVMRSLELIGNHVVPHFAAAVK
ncbi:MAG TPA: LLM class flavin-dependent oxidoreductase [Dehalococcoidia bacterium]|nr:LLM class flavin-dependent oxidoreductase [Dehalococcoidia bacterium]